MTEIPAGGVPASAGTGPDRGGTTQGRPVLQLSGVVVSVPDGPGARRLLDGVDLVVRPGELVAVMGPSGSGKSTLLQVAAGLRGVDAGWVEVAGRQLNECGPAEWTRLRREGIGYVEQRWNLISALTVAENVALPLELAGVPVTEALTQARQALERVNLSGRGDDPVDRLSGGEAQRAALARGWIGRRRLLVADEPTAALDASAGELVMQLLREACDQWGQGVLMATHDPSHAAWADRVFRIRSGKLTAPAETNPGGSNRREVS